MKTNLYIPFTDFIINNIDGQKILYENLVQSGPAYKLIVHESPSWIKLKEELGLEKTIDIISDKKAKDYKKKYKELIEKHHNFLELLNSDESPFKSKFYYSDESMLWAANYLTL